MTYFKRALFRLAAVFFTGVVFALFSQVFSHMPADRYIHIRSFRYGKDPWVIRCNRGDRLHLTFSSDDTGHSFFLEEFDVDVKVNGSSDDVAVFRPSDPTVPPVFTKEVLIVAERPGIKNILMSRYNYRCHAWCGPMHGFEQGKLIILPNALLFFSLGCIVAVIALWLAGFPVTAKKAETVRPLPRRAEKFLVSRWPQVILMLLALFMITLVIITSVLGTKMSGRNLGVLLMWSVWLFLLITVMTPLGGRIWCTICPLPVFGDLIQRGSLFAPLKGKRGQYNSSFFGLFRKWPVKLSNNWIRIILFMTLATFSTTLVATPRISGLTILALVILPTVMSVIWELRAFCRYVCPVHAFVGPFSRMSITAVRNRSQEVCDNCRPKYCTNGNAQGWACPYGVNVGELKDSADCGMCLECMRSCSYGNVTLVRRSFCSEENNHDLSNSWLNIAIFSIAVIYSILYLGPWPAVRDWVNILDKQNWGYFGIYSLTLWIMVLLVVPGIIYLLSAWAKRLSSAELSQREVFGKYTGVLLPLGLMLWMSFVIPMLFVNMTFIIQSLSDPFGWGWDFFGTANTPWHQFLPDYIPWFQSILIVAGLWLSLKRLSSLPGEQHRLSKRQKLLLGLPLALFLTAVSVGMIFFFTN